MRRLLQLALTLALTTLFSPALAEEVVSAFEGSEFLGSFERDYDQLPILEDGAGGSLEHRMLEGKLHSRLLRKPATKSALEVFRSYENELKAGGFEILMALENDERKVRNVLWTVFRTETKFADRPYMNGAKKSATSDKSFLYTFTEWYLLARKNTADATVHVALMISKERDLYNVDVLTSAAMETGTVKLNAKVLSSALEKSGKVAIYDIHFDTNSAQIRSESAGALEVIAQVLNQHADLSFFVVGHTDGTGSLDHNVTLSKQRADAVVEALTTQHGIAAGRLTARGVGPLAPVGSNHTEGDRALNRRVEIVVRL